MEFQKKELTAEMKLPAIPGIETSWRLKGHFADGKERIFSAPDAAVTEETEHSCRWQCAGGMEVLLRRDDSGFHLSFDKCPAGLEIREIQFPVWDLASSDLRMLLPKSTGFMTGPIRDWAENAALSCSFFPFQMAACFGPGRNILVMLPDEEHYLKNIKVCRKGDHFEAAVSFYVPQEKEPVRSCAVPYPVILEEFTGGWFDAAERYRRFAWNTGEYRKAKEHVNPLRNTAMWFWNRGGADEVGDPVIRFAKESGLPVALDWYWWHHNAYDTDYPYYWPPREGEEVFTRKIAELKKNGVFTQVYTNGMTWDMDNPSWKNGGEQSAVVLENGEILNVPFNRYNHHRLAFMCGESEPFQQEIFAQAEKIRQAGVDGLYLDMCGCVSNFYPCRNPLHKHTRGGGKYQHQGFARYLGKVRELNPGLSLSTEDCTEEYLDLFDSMIVLCHSWERLTDGLWTTFRGEFVPVFLALYHRTAALFGSYAVPDGIPPWDDRWPDEDRWPENEEEEWEKLYPDQFYLEVALNIINGMQPSVHCLRNRHWTDPRFREIMDFLLDAAKFYAGHLDWLFDGEMLDPGELTVPQATVRFMTRSIYTTKKDFRSHERQLPAVLHSVWRSPEGKDALFLANYTANEQTFEFEGFRGKLPPRSWKCIMLQSGKR